MPNTPLELYVAARGWDHAEWYGKYYPDDLPEDWRLAFYSNEFRAIVVPEPDWIAVDPVEIERWVDDTPEEFLFFLEVENPLIDWHTVNNLVGCLGDQLGGFLLRPGELDADLSIIANSLVTATKLAPACLLIPGSVELSQAGRTLLKEHEVECCWNVGDGKPGWTESQLDSRLAVARVSGNKTFTARELREIIETCLQYGMLSHWATTRRVLLMIDSENPQVKDLSTATMIGDMLVMPAS